MTRGRFMQEADYLRELVREDREALLIEEEDYGYRAGVGTGDDWTGSVNE